MANSVGKDILNYCGKCKMVLSSTIVAMLGPDVIKVQCNTCKSVQKFKPNMPSVKKSVPTVANKGPSASTTTRIHDVWESRMKNNKNEPIRYNIKTQFKLGDFIDHTKFGPGYVEKIVDNDKIDVLFQYEIKTLVHNKG